MPVINSLSLNEKNCAYNLHHWGYTILRVFFVYIISRASKNKSDKYLDNGKFGFESSIIPAANHCCTNVACFDNVDVSPTTW